MLQCVTVRRQFSRIDLPSASFDSGPSSRPEEIGDLALLEVSAGAEMRVLLLVEVVPPFV
jgi:hypothetical protein